MSIFDKKIKLGCVTVFIVAIFALCFGTLSGYMFKFEGTGFEKGVTANFVTVSFVYIAVWFLYSFYIGYHYNYGGLIAQGAITLLPFLGLIGPGWYSVFITWGTVHLVPALSVIKSLYNSLTAIFVLLIAMYVVSILLYYAGTIYKKKQAY